MIMRLELCAKGDISTQDVLRWFRAVQQAAVEIEGVYDLALFSEALTQPNNYSCALDAQDEETTLRFWSDPRVTKALAVGRDLGLELIPRSRWNRMA